MFTDRLAGSKAWPGARGEIAAARLRPNQCASGKQSFQGRQLVKMSLHEWQAQGIQAEHDYSLILTHATNSAPADKDTYMIKTLILCP